MSSEQDRAQRHAALRQFARSSMLERVQVIEDYAAAVLTAPADTDLTDQREQARVVAHKIAGAAGSFGWAEASLLGREAENLLTTPGPDDLTQAVRLAEISEQTRSIISQEPDPVVSSPTSEDHDVSTVATGRYTHDIAVVEDDAPLAALITQVLGRDGWQIFWVPDGVAGNEALNPPQSHVRARLVLLDIDLPGRSGLSLLRALQRHGVLRHTRVLMLSSRFGAEDREVARRLGAAGFVPKPFAIDVLRSTVRDTLTQNEPAKTAPGGEPHNLPCAPQMMIEAQSNEDMVAGEHRHA